MTIETWTRSEQLPSLVHAGFQQDGLSASQPAAMQHTEPAPHLQGAARRARLAGRTNMAAACRHYAAPP